jgi:threonine/homoserine/homoserine lactone efflux protein
VTTELYLTYVLACVVIAVIPGPTVTVIVANSLAHGTRAGLLNVAGTQLGLGLMMTILIVGLSSVIAAMSWLFDWLRIAGAVYLVYIGYRLLRSPDAMDVEPVCRCRTTVRASWRAPSMNPESRRCWKRWPTTYTRGARVTPWCWRMLPSGSGMGSRSHG